MAKWFRKAFGWLVVALGIAGAWALSLLRTRQDERGKVENEQKYKEDLSRIESLKGNEAHREELLRKREGK